MQNCVFCELRNDLESEPLFFDYDHWTLLLQSEKKRKLTKQAAGLLVTKRHVEDPSRLRDAEAIELLSIIKDASRRLCEAVGVTYTDQESAGFNIGPEAGQTVFHAHVHILPVAEEDPIEMKQRGGIGGAFEALRRAKLG